jgi:hypothetical protein
VKRGNMPIALDLVASGRSPRFAAEVAEVNLQSLYRRLRRDKPRCPTCGRVSASLLVVASPQELEPMRQLGSEDAISQSLSGG